MAIEYLGVAVVQSAASSSTLSITTTSLNRDGFSNAYTSRNNDFCLVISGWSATTNGDPGVTTPTATEVADLYANATSDTNTSVAYFFTGVGLSSITISSVANTTDGKTGIALFFRGVDRGNPIDATTTTATGTNTGVANPPAITPVTTGATVVIAGGSAKAGAASSSAVAPANYSLIADTWIAGSSRAYNSAAAYRQSLTGGVAEDPGNFTIGNGGSGASWCVATVALRPALGQIKEYTGSAWLAYPVRYWNGSAWVVKPLKRYNGSAWVKTNY